MIKRIVPVVLGLVALAARSPAQDYSFSLPRNVSWLEINQQGEADLYYELTFVCHPGAHPIDIVDIGMPNGSYQLNGAMARIGQDELDDIRVSEYVKPHGVEVHLGGRTIMPGDSATLFFGIRLRQVLGADSGDREYASVVFSPTWYGSQYVSGSSRLEFNLVFPPGVGPQETRYHRERFSESWTDTAGNTVVYRWVTEDARPDRQYTFGASFPARYVPPGSVRRQPPLWQRALAGLGRMLWGIIHFFLGSLFFWIFGLIVFLGIRQNRTRRMKYLPPEVSVEGAGIKRGLTAPQAGIILEMPLDKVLSMVLFGLVKKEALEVVAREPRLRVKVTRAEAAVHPYEKDFLAALDQDGVPQQAKLREAAIKLIQEVNDKMKGFSRKDTAAYYRGIIAQAWKQVQEAGTPELKSQPLEDQFDWLMMDGDYRNRMQQHYGTGEVLLPRWWGRSGYGYRSGGGGTSTGRSGGAGVEMPRLPGADFANRITTGAESMAAGLVGKLDSFTGGVTSKTNPVPASSSGRSSGGGGCACACACAGCACACAGGGR